MSRKNTRYIIIYYMLVWYTKVGLFITALDVPCIHSLRPLPAGDMELDELCIYFKVLQFSVKRVSEKVLYNAGCSKSFCSNCAGFPTLIERLYSIFSTAQWSALQSADAYIQDNNEERHTTAQRTSDDKLCLSSDGYTIQTPSNQWALTKTSTKKYRVEKSETFKCYVVTRIILPT